MKLRLIHGAVGLALLWGVFAVTPDAWCGPLRINMNDGTAVEVPYYWEEGGEIKFEIPGGVTGIPKGQVASVQEVIEASEFDPEVMLGSSHTEENPDRMKALEEVVAANVPGVKAGEKLSTEESLQALRAEEASGESKSQNERIFLPTFNIEGDFTELVRVQGSGVSLVIHKVLSSRKDLRSRGVTLALYDGEGRVLQKKPCEVYELDAEQATLKKLGVRNRLFSVMASVRPDPKIKRYEIITAH